MDALTTDIEGGAESAATATAGQPSSEDRSDDTKAAVGDDEAGVTKNAPASKPPTSALDEMQEKIR